MSTDSVVLGVDVRGETRSVAACDSSRSTMWKLIACSWLLMLVTFSPPRIGSKRAADSFDSIAIAKLAVRTAVLGIMSLLVIRQWSTTRRKEVMRLLLPWIVFTGWMVLSVSWSPLRTISLGQAGSFAVLLLLGFNFALYAESSDIEPVVKQVTWGLLVACCLLLAICVVLPDWGCLTREGRGLMHATNGAATASIGCVLLFAARWVFGWKWGRRLFWPALVVFGATLIVAQNRTAVGLTSAIMLGLAACIAPATRALVMAVVGIGGSIYLVLDLQFGTTDAIFDTLATYLARGQTTVQLAALSGREEMWTKMWNSFLESPWIGHGWFVSSAQGKMKVWYLWTNWTAHNFWLQVLVSTGVVGAALMVWALLNPIFRLLRAWDRGDINWRFAVFVGSIFAWQTGWGINNESFVGPLQPESVVFFVILGLVIGRFAEAKIARNESRTNRNGYSTAFSRRFNYLKGALRPMH
jgi:hypothetical protein